MKWGTLYPPIIFILLVALVYVCIVPIIEPFCAISFGLSYVVYKHQCLNVYSQVREAIRRVTLACVHVCAAL